VPAIIHIDREKFDDFVLNGRKPAVVSFSAEWCGPCRRLALMMEELAGEYGDRVNVCSADMDAAGDIASRYLVTEVPCILFFKDGQVVGRVSGESEKEAVIQRMISALG
jgi:thioredoxin 1